jgi:hypothetical protein
MARVIPALWNLRAHPSSCLLPMPPLLGRRAPSERRIHTELEEGRKGISRTLADYVVTRHSYVASHVRRKTKLSSPSEFEN